MITQMLTMPWYQARVRCSSESTSGHTDSEHVALGTSDTRHQHTLIHQFAKSGRHTPHTIVEARTYTTVREIATRRGMSSKVSSYSVRRLGAPAAYTF